MSDKMREALDNSQSLLVMIYQIGADPAVWGSEGIEDLISTQVVENRSVLDPAAPSRPVTAEPKYCTFPDCACDRARITTHTCVIGLPDAPAAPPPAAGRDLAEELREYTAMKYMGDCKCGKCQLVPRELVERIYHTLNSAALTTPPASPSPSVIDFLMQWTSRESRPVIDVARDMAKAWDKGEHEGCGADSERAYKKWAASQTAPAAAGRERPTGGLEYLYIKRFRTLIMVGPSIRNEVKALLDGPAVTPQNGNTVSIDLMSRIWANLFYDEEDAGNTFQQTLNEVVDWLAARNALPSRDCFPVLTTPPAPGADRAAVIEECMAVVGNMRQSEAGLFDAKHSGQRGCDRADALYDAYVAIRALTLPRAELGTGGGK